MSVYRQQLDAFRAARIDVATYQAMLQILYSDMPEPTITLGTARAHWFDKSAACNQMQAYRDDVMRYYWLYFYAPDRGRRWRGRMLDRANRELSWTRQQCAFCRCWVRWSPTCVLPGRGWRP